MLNQSSGKKQENPYYFTDADGNKLLPQGMRLLCNHYREKHNLNNLFSAENYNEANSLIAKLKENQNRFGIVYINTSLENPATTHKGSILIDGNKAFILDPLGIGVGSGAQSFKEYLVTQKTFESKDIYLLETPIQKDKTSCGTLSFLFMKEALRMQDTFKNFILDNSNNNRIGTLPPNLLKYMQSINKIKEAAEQAEQEYKIYPEIPIRKKPGKTESLIKYSERHQKTSPGKSGNMISVALTNRAEKHIRVINEFLSKPNEALVILQNMKEVHSSPVIIITDHGQNDFLFTPEKNSGTNQSYQSNSNQEEDYTFLGFLPTPQVTPQKDTSTVNSPERFLNDITNNRILENASARRLNFSEKDA